MNLENVNGSDRRRYAPSQENTRLIEPIPEVEWDDLEAQDIATELIGRREEEY